MHFTTFIKLLQKIKNAGLPGDHSQFKMAAGSPLRFDQRHIIGQNPRKAGVLVLFYPNEKGESCFLLILRKTYEGIHSAQISFPGGKQEDFDSSLQQTALRESYEEVGIATEKVNIIKRLTTLYVPPSNFIVTPFMGTLMYTPVFKKNTHEVETLIEVPLSSLFSKENHTTAIRTISFAKEIRVPAFCLNGYTVWGATAMILCEVKDLLERFI